MPRCEVRGCIGQIAAIEPGLAMNHVRRLQRLDQRTRATGMDRHLAAPGKIADTPGIGLRPVQRHIARNRGDGLDIKLIRTGEGEQQSHRIVNSRIAVNNDSLALGHERKIGGGGKLRQVVLPERLEPSAWFRYSRPLKRTRGTPVQKSEIEKVQRYLRQTFGNHGISIEGRPNKDDSAEVSLDGEFIGVIFKDDEEGDVSYDFHMTILEMDLN